MGVRDLERDLEARRSAGGLGADLDLDRLGDLAESGVSDFERVLERFRRDDLCDEDLFRW